MNARHIGTHANTCPSLLSSDLVTKMADPDQLNQLHAYIGHQKAAPGEGAASIYV